MAKRILKATAWVLAWLAGTGLVLSWSHRERMPLDDATRAAWGGSYAALPTGNTRYVRLGTPTGRTLVLVHGGGDTLEMWRPHVADFLAAQRPVLLYDLHGHGASERVPGRHDLPLMVAQLAALLDALGLEEPVDLAGFSTGGAVAVGFADAHPQRVRSLALIAPAGLDYRVPWKHRLARAPILGDIMMSTLGPALIRDSYGGPYSEAERYPAHVMVHELPMLEIEGTGRALLSVVREFSLRGMDAEFARLQQRSFPLLIVLGGRDRLITPPVQARMQELVPRARFEVFVEVTHGLVVDEATRLRAILAQWP